MKYGKNRIISLGLALCLSLGFALPIHAVKAESFTDVGEKDWYYNFVTDLAGQEIVSGYPDGSFQPGKDVTVGEALSLILLSSGHERKEPTREHWASGLADYAVKNLYLPSRLREKLDEPMTRLDVAQLAAKALKLVAARGESAFADTEDGYVNVLFNKKLLAGNLEDGQRLFKPEAPISRAEMAAIVWNIRNTDVYAGMIGTEYYYVDVLDGVPVNPYDPKAFRLEGQLMTYTDPAMKTMVGVDVASFQGEIDWEKVKESGVDFAIIRIGGRGYTEGKLYDDKKFEENMEGALAAGVQVGAYFFSQCITEEEALEEAEYVLQKLEPYRDRITMPVVFDWEDLGNSGHRGYRLDSDILGACANLFCGKMQDAGYQTMIYFNRFGGYRSYDLRQVLEHQFWFAQYISTTDYPTFYYDFDMWQYTSKGRVPGINADVDMNLYFVKDRPEKPQKPEEKPEKPENRPSVVGPIVRPVKPAEPEPEAEKPQKPEETPDSRPVPPDGVLPPDGMGL